MYDLILASSSRYRQQQLASLGYEFQSVAPEIDESPRPKETPYLIAKRLASLKAKSVAQKFPQSIVVGSDQTGICNGQLLEKPILIERAIEMLLSYRGQSICFYSAVVVLHPDGKELSDVVQTEVRFRDFTRREVMTYISLDEPLDCAGALKSEAHGSLLFKSVRSEDHTALIGLPLIRTAEFLRELGINPLACVDPKILQNTVGREHEY